MFSSIPTTELAFLTSLFALFVPLLSMPSPQHAAAKKMTPATREWWNVCSCLERPEPWNLSQSWSWSGWRGWTRTVTVQFPRVLQYCLSPHLTSTLEAWPTADSLPLSPAPPASRERLSQRGMLYGVKGTGKVKEHDAHCALRPIQVLVSSVKQMDDGIIHIDVSLISKLQRLQIVMNQGPQDQKDVWRLLPAAPHAPWSTCGFIRLGPWPYWSLSRSFWASPW